MQALLVAKWPVELQYHHQSCIQQMAQLLPEQAAEVGKANQVAFSEQAALKEEPIEAAFPEAAWPVVGEGVTLCPCPTVVPRKHSHWSTEAVCKACCLA